MPPMANSVPEGTAPPMMDSELPPGHPPIGGDPGMAPAASSKEISWKVPEGWQEQSPSEMRVGSFLRKNNGKQADISVVPLSGDAGGDLANINRWRGQISLGPVADNDLPQQSQKIAPAGRPMNLVNYANQGKRLVAAIYHRGGRTWFFKMTGDDALVAATKPSFLEFLNSLKFNDDKAD